MRSREFQQKLQKRAAKMSRQGSRAGLSRKGSLQSISSSTVPRNAEFYSPRNQLDSIIKQRESSAEKPQKDYFAL